MTMLLLAAALLSASPAPAEDWALISESEKGVIYSLDRDSVRDMGEYRQAWTRTDYSKVAEGDVSLRRARADFDCSGRRVRLRGTVAYDRSGGILRTSNFEESESPWREVQPGTMGESTLEAVCAAEIRG